MKLSLLAFLFASVSARTITGENARNLIRNARRLEDQQDQQDNADAEEEEEYAFLMKYKLKLRSCKAGEAIRNPENGEYDFNAVVFRLCPDDGTCDDEGSEGCGEGYGDYVVGLNTFIQGYLEDQEENMQGDDNFNVADYAECREYDQEEEEDEDGNDNDADATQYWIGPACSEDGTDIVMKMFSDEACQTVPEDVTFEEVSNGWSLPYSEGGLVSTYCTSCTEEDDDGNAETKELCQRLYEDAGKCETEMNYYHYYGKQDDSCGYIQELLPARGSRTGGKVFGWFVLFAVVAFAGYAVWWKKQKARNNADALMA